MHYEPLKSFLWEVIGLNMRHKYLLFNDLWLPCSALFSANVKYYYNQFGAAAEKCSFEPSHARGQR